LKEKPRLVYRVKLSGQLNTRTVHPSISNVKYLHELCYIYLLKKQIKKYKKSKNKLLSLRRIDYSSAYQYFYIFLNMIIYKQTSKTKIEGERACKERAREKERGEMKDSLISNKFKLINRIEVQNNYNYNKRIRWIP
jgi:hypothetical protein